MISASASVNLASVTNISPLSERRAVSKASEAPPLEASVLKISSPSVLYK
jgi:hypothetical protein